MNGRKGRAISNCLSLGRLVICLFAVLELAILRVAFSLGYHTTETRFYTGQFKAVFLPKGSPEEILFPYHLDEDVSVEGIVAGRRSMESAESFRRWLEDRRERGVIEQ